MAKKLLNNSLEINVLDIKISTILIALNLINNKSANTTEINAAEINAAEINAAEINAATKEILINETLKNFPLTDITLQNSSLNKEQLKTIMAEEITKIEATNIDKLNHSFNLWRLILRGIFFDDKNQINDFHEFLILLYSKEKLTLFEYLEYKTTNIKLEITEKLKKYSLNSNKKIDKDQCYNRKEDLKILEAKTKSVLESLKLFKENLEKKEWRSLTNIIAITAISHNNYTFEIKPDQKEIILNLQSTNQKLQSITLIKKNTLYFQLLLDYIGEEICWIIKNEKIQKLTITTILKSIETMAKIVIDNFSTKSLKLDKLPLTKAIIDFIETKKIIYSPKNDCSQTSNDSKKIVLVPLTKKEKKRKLKTNNYDWYDY